MFDFIRTHTKAIQLLMLVFVLPGFFLFGIEGFMSMSEKSETVAVVAGKKIGQIEWDAAVKEDVDRIRQNARGADPKMFDSPEFKYAALERLVNRRVLEAAVQKFHLDVSDQNLAATLLQDPSFAALRKPDGTLDQAKYKELLSPQGLTPQAFEARMRVDISAQQALQALAKSGMVPAALADVALSAYFEKREIQVVKFLPQEVAKKITPTDAEIETFYKANLPLFQATEKASVEYVVLDLDHIKKTITPSEAEIKSYYEQNNDRLSGGEERKVRHILIEVPQTASTDDREKAKKRAEDLLAQVRKSPASFADIAKKNSQDTASASNGGDLGFFPRGAMVKSFEDAAFSMQPKQISDLVETDFGYHIIQLTEIKAPKKSSFAEMKPGIEADLQKQMAQKKFAEVAEVFTNMVYEQSDTLKPVADKLKLEIQSAQNVMRQPLPNARGALASPKFLGALFSVDSLDKKRNTEAVQIGVDQLVAGRIVSYTPAQTIPYQEAKEKAKALLTERLSISTARAEGLAKLAQLTVDPAATPTQLSAPIIVSRDALAEQSPKLVDTVLRASTAKLPLWLGVDLGEGGYRVVLLKKVIDDKVEHSPTVQNRDQYLQIWLAAEAASYYEYLKEKFKVQIKVNKPEPKTRAG